MAWLAATRTRLAAGGRLGARTPTLNRKCTLNRQRLLCARRLRSSKIASQFPKSILPGILPYKFQIRFTRKFASQFPKPFYPYLLPMKSENESIIRKANRLENFLGIMSNVLVGALFTGLVLFILAMATWCWVGVYRTIKEPNGCVCTKHKS